MNVCSGWLPSFKKKMVHSQPTKAWDTHPAAEWQCDFAPYILQPWLMSDNIRMKKNGCRCTSNVQWARRLAWVFDYMPLFRGSMGGYKRRTMVPEDTDLGTRWTEVSRWERKYKMHAVGPYNFTFLTSLGTSYSFFFFSYFTAAFGN